MAKILIFIIGLGLALFGAIRFLSRPASTDTITLDIKNRSFSLEIARTPVKKARGLMNRTNLPQNGGMIFVSAFELPQVFWMKNTLIPLDMIFLDKNGRIVNIETAVPEAGIADDQLKLYHSVSPAKYVIEFNAGTASELNLKPGDSISLTGL